MEKERENRFKFRERVHSFLFVALDVVIQHRKCIKKLLVHYTRMMMVMEFCNNIDTRGAFAGLFE